MIKRSVERGLKGLPYKESTERGQRESSNLTH